LRIFSVSKPNETHCPEFGHILSRDVRILSDKGLLKNGQIFSCFSLINGAIRSFSSSSLEDAGSSSLEDAGSSSAVSVMGAGNSLTGDNSLFDNSLNGDDSLFGDNSLKGDDSLFGITPPIPRETVLDSLLDAFEFFLV
jgi:hypothetical protein